MPRLTDESPVRSPTSSRSSSRSRAAAATSTSTTRRRSVFRLDRVLSSAVYYNFDYGFIEGTRAGDGDHTDALLIIDEPTFTGCHVWARPIGGLEMHDEKGFDFKVLCVAIGDAHQQHIEGLDQVRPHRLVEIEHFFQTYKALEDKTVEVLGWRDRDRALEVLRADRAAWDRETAKRPTRPTRPPDRVTARAADHAGPAPTCPVAGCSSRSRSRPRRPQASPRSSRSVRSEGVPGGGRDVRWVRLDGLHLTLRFIGPTAEDRVDVAREAVLAAAAAVDAFDISIGGAGAFPPFARPRALWLGIAGGRGLALDPGPRSGPGAGRRRLGPRREAVPPAPDARPIRWRPGGGSDRQIAWSPPPRTSMPASGPSGSACSRA